MENKKKRNIIIAAILCLLLIIGVVFAILSKNPKLSASTNASDDWNVKITAVEVKTKKGSAVDNSHTFNNLSVAIRASVFEPGDSIEYEVTVENKGNVKATLSQISTTSTNEFPGLIFSNSGMGQGEILDANATGKINIKIEYESSASTISESNLNTLTYNLDLIFNKYTESNVVDSSVKNVSNTCFAVNEDGLITDYDFINCGLNVKVPYKVNGNVVKKVDHDSFYGKGYHDYMKENGYGVVVGNFTWGSIGGKIPPTYALFETEEDLNKFISISDPDVSKSEYVHGSNTSLLVVGDLSDWSKVKIPVGIDKIIYVDDNGKEVEPSKATEVIYVFPGDTKYGFVGNDSALSVCNKYAKSGTGSINTCYRVGSKEANSNPDITNNTKYYSSLKDLDKKNDDNWFAYFDYEGKKSYGDWVYFTNTHIKSLDFSNATGLTEISNEIVRESLEKVIFNEGLQKIGEFAFSDNPNLGNVDIPSTVTNVGTDAFRRIGSDKIIRIRRKDATGLTLGDRWNDEAFVVYKP